MDSIGGVEDSDPALTCPFLLCSVLPLLFPSFSLNLLVLISSLFSALHYISISFFSSCFSPPPCPSIILLLKGKEKLHVKGKQKYNYIISKVWAFVDGSGKEVKKILCGLVTVFLRSLFKAASLEEI